jgi:hypothetical protein
MAIHSRKRPRFVRKGLAPDPARLLDSGITASRLNELDFAGVCPMASPDPADTKIRANRAAKRTAILSV